MSLPWGLKPGSLKKGVPEDKAKAFVVGVQKKSRFQKVGKGGAAEC